MTKTEISNYKRKVQQALRRYVLKKSPSKVHAHLFGIDVDGFREWIELQFEGGMNWTNCGKMWEFTHIVPVYFFDVSNEEDARLCWNFTNITIGQKGANKNAWKSFDINEVSYYFRQLAFIGEYEYALKISNKLTRIQPKKIGNGMVDKKVSFVIDKMIKGLSEFNDLNNEEFVMMLNGATINDIELQRKMIKNYGS